MSTKRPDELTLDETIDDLNRRGFAGHFGVNCGRLTRIRHRRDVPSH